MRSNRPGRMLAFAGAVSLLLTGLAGAAQAPAPAAAQASGFADPAFQRTWTRTDSLVANSTVRRSWFWGPQPNSGPLYEDYAQGPNGKHLVQYFDKSRMEINNPSGDPNNPFYVTNGLLTYELITGQVQTGDNSWQLRWPANIPLASDMDMVDAITYSSFRGAIVREDTPKIGQIANAVIFSNGSLDFVHGGAGYYNFDQYNVRQAYYEPATKHNIPDVFWQFLDQSGPVVENGRVVNARLSNPYFYVTGYPISEAYWTAAKIEGKPDTAVLVQPYQRRVLTYVPSAAQGWRVQMGNIGQHYYDWRYKDAGKPQVLTGCPNGYPVGGFGKVYNDNPQIKFILGCQQSPENRATVSQQPFEHGQLIGVTRYSFYSGENYEEVYALFEDGTAQTFSYFPSSVTPTAEQLGSFTSTHNFAVTWSNNQAVKSRLGNPTQAALVTVAGTSGGGGGVIQEFAGGLMVYPTLDVRRIYVLYNTTGYGYAVQGPHLTYTSIDRWAGFNDTYQP